MTRLTIVTLAPALAALAGGCPASGECGLASCSEAEYCAWDDYACGAGPYTPVCRAKPAECMMENAPVCGCDGTVHASPCEAALAGVDLAAEGCAAPAGTFACGPFFCATATQYCSAAQTFGSPQSFACLGLPAGCGASPECGCLGGVGCLGGGPAVCTTTAGGGLRIDC